MGINNVYLIEVVSKSNDLNQIISEIKKCLNVCRLSKFKSVGECVTFYSAFFLNSLQNDVNLNVEEWGTIYNTLLNDNVFCNNLSLYIVSYHPQEYTSMFGTIRNMIPVELNTTKNKIRYLSQTKATLMMIQKGFTSVSEMTRIQTLNPDSVKFLTVILTSIDSIIMYVNKLLNNEMANSVKDDDITITMHGTFLTEDGKNLIDVINSAYELIGPYNECVDILLNEGIVNKAKEAVQAAAVKMKKMQQNFDEKVMRAWKKLQTERRNRKHAEIVGEALRITNEIKRLMISAPAALISPALAVIIWAGTLAIDRHTDKKDRDILVGQIKDELEIVEEKIQIADRKGDDKERIELIRIRQKLVKEYERISKMRYRKTL